MVKKVKCDVCNYEFIVNKTETYRVRKSDLFSQNNIYDAIDCPKCGCQKILHYRADIVKGVTKNDSVRK